MLSTAHVHRAGRFLIAVAALIAPVGLAYAGAVAARPAAHPVQPRLVSLAVLPKAVMLRGPYAEVRVLIDDVSHFNLSLGRQLRRLPRVEM